MGHDRHVGALVVSLLAGLRSLPTVGIVRALAVTLVCRIRRLETARLELLRPLWNLVLILPNVAPDGSWISIPSPNAYLRAYPKGRSSYREVLVALLVVLIGGDL